MTTFSAWSYTATATFWAPTLDAYSQPSAWARSTFACSFKAGGRQGVSSTGEEFVPNQTIYLEASVASAPKEGWKVKIGNVTDASPPSDAQTVRAVMQHDPSTFGEGLPDFVVMT